MTSLRQLVDIFKFKNLAKQLTDNEFNQFMANVSKAFNDRNLILNLLSGAFEKPSNQQDIITKMTKMITKIIRNRSNTTQQSSITKVDQLPSQIIGEISSYLYQREYTRFSIIN